MAQEPTGEVAVPRPTSAWHGHLPLGFDGVGLCLGNSRRWDGLRINVRDHGVERVRGVNVTLWSPRNPGLERFEGVALGLSPVAGISRGIALGLVASVTDREATGVQLGGLATVSGGDARGVNLGGLAVVSEGDLRGVNAAGLATVAEGRIIGLNLAGLSVVSQGGIRGINAGGLAVVAQGGVRGANLAGLAIVSEGGTRGIQAAGLAVVSEGSQRGVGLAGLACVTGSSISGASVAGLATVAGDRIEGVAVSGLATVFGHELRGIGLGGLTVGSGNPGLRDLALSGPPDAGRNTTARGVLLAGYRVQANRIEGLAGALGVLRAHDVTGLSFGAFHGVSGRQTGASVGLFNYASELRGVQIGLLNYVGNNPPWARWLPIVNMRF